VPGELAAFVHDAGAIVDYVVGLELDHSRGVEQTATGPVEDLQPGPALFLVQLDPTWPGPRMPGLQKVRRVENDKGTIP
jgi:hypothetical protein